MQKACNDMHTGFHLDIGVCDADFDVYVLDSIQHRLHASAHKRVGHPGVLTVLFAGPFPNGVEFVEQTTAGTI